MKEFHARLKQLRTEKKMTQKELAMRVGLASSAISAYEVGDRYPTYEVMCAFSRIFHVSTDYLLGIEKPRQLDLSGLSDENIELVVRLVNTLRKE